MMQTDVLGGMCDYAHMPDILQDNVRALIRKIVDQTGIKPAALARLAGLAPSTLTRFLNSADVTHTLSARTLAKVMAVIDEIDLAEFPARPAAGRRGVKRRQQAPEPAEGRMLATLLWELTPSGNPGPPAVPKGGEFVKKLDELALLAFWRSRTREERRLIGKMLLDLHEARRHTA